RSKAACRTGLITAPSAALALLLLFFAAVCLIFSASSFGWLSKAPRYVLPLYSVIFVLTGVLSAALLESRSLLKRSAAVCLPLLLLGLQLASQFWPHVPIPGQPFIFRGQRVMTDHRPLYEWLRSNNYRHIRTNYWVGYRTAFETNEEITFTRFGTPRSLRLPDYERHDSMDDFRGVYVLSPLQAALVINSFNKFGLTYRRSDVGGYTIIDQIRPVYEHGPRIDLFPEQFSASSRLDWIPGLLDGDPKTRWGSGTAQHPGMYVEIAFGSPTPVSGLEMRLGDYPQDAPRRLLIQGLRADGIWQDLLDSQGTFYDLNNTELNELPRTWQLYHPPSCFSKVRLVQQGTVEVLDWSIADLMLYSAEGIACSTP
ncbi:MAG TPA: hypothetical protein PLP17_05080, partial [Oligoflexia bacterium]|nr:hypothetical protein [Oligoflexia bacterium]